MNDTIMKLRILARSEMTLARINARLMATRTMFYAVAVALLLLTVVMVNLGAYQLLAETYGNAQAAFIVALADGVLAGLFVLAGRMMKPGSEEQMVRDIREMALSDLTSDANAALDDFKKVGANLEKIRAGFSSFTGEGSRLASLASLGPVVAMVINALKRHRESRGSDDS